MYMAALLKMKIPSLPCYYKWVCDKVLTHGEWKKEYGQFLGQVLKRRNMLSYVPFIYFALSQWLESGCDGWNGLTYHGPYSKNCELMVINQKDRNSLDLLSCRIFNPFWAGYIWTVKEEWKIFPYFLVTDILVLLL